MSTMADCAITLDAAHEYITRGWHILACQPKGKDPYFRYAPKAYLSATDSHYDIDEWFDHKPNLNIGVAARQSGLIILDIDNRNLEHAGQAILDELHDRSEHHTYTVTTGDGYHLYYAATNLPQRIPGKLADGIDVKYNGYVVAAPSTHPSGREYQVTDNRDLAPIPAWLIGGKR